MNEDVVLYYSFIKDILKLKDGELFRLKYEIEHKDTRKSSMLYKHSMHFIIYYTTKQNIPMLFASLIALYLGANEDTETENEIADFFEKTKKLPCSDQIHKMIEMGYAFIRLFTYNDEVFAKSTIDQYIEKAEKESHEINHTSQYINVLYNTIKLMIAFKNENDIEIEESSAQLINFNIGMINKDIRLGFECGKGLLSFHKGQYQTSFICLNQIISEIKETKPKLISKCEPLLVISAMAVGEQIDYRPKYLSDIYRAYIEEDIEKFVKCVCTELDLAIKIELEKISDSVIKRMNVNKCMDVMQVYSRAQINFISKECKSCDDDVLSAITISGTHSINEETGIISKKPSAIDTEVTVRLINTTFQTGKCVASSAGVKVGGI